MTDYIDSQGWRVTTHDSEADEVKFYQAGGGFEHQLPYVKFHEAFLPAPARTWRRGTVTADFWEGEPLPCWTDGTLWNGWGMPYFAREQIDQILAVDGVAVRWDGDWLIDFSYGEAPDEIEIIKPLLLDGVQVWGLGAGSWCWNAIEVTHDDT